MVDSSDIEDLLVKAKRNYIKKKMIQLGWLFQGEATAEDYARFGRIADQKFDATYVLQCALREE